MFADAVKDLASRSLKTFNPNDLAIFWLGNNDIKFIDDKNIDKMFEIYKNNLDNLITK